MRHSVIGLIMILVFVASGCTGSVEEGGSDLLLDGAMEIIEVVETALTTDTSAYPSAPPPGMAILDAGLPPHAWSIILGGDKVERVHDMAVDSYGCTVIGGYTTSPTITMGGVTVAPSGVGASGGSSKDGYVARISSDGIPFWIKTIGDEYPNDEVTTVTTGTDGTVYVAGVTGETSSFVFAGETLHAEGTSFVAAYDTAGNELWLRSCETGRPEDITVLDDGAIAVIGRTELYKAWCGEGPVHEGYNDITLLVLEPGGEVRWFERFGGELDDEGVGVIPGPDGSLVLAARYRSYDLDFGGGWLTSENVTDIALASLAADGTYLWAEKFGGDPFEVPSHIAATGSGFFVGGRFDEDALDFGTGPLTECTEGEGDVFVASFDLAGKNLWAFSIGGDMFESIESIAVSPQGTAYVLMYYFCSWIDVGIGALVNPLPPYATTALLEVDATGSIIAARQWQSFSLDTSHQHIAASPDGYLIYAHDFLPGFGPSLVGDEIEVIGEEDVIILALKP